MSSAPRPDEVRPRTKLKRIREARPRLRAAQEEYPHLSPLEALLTDLEARQQGELDDQSIRNYRQTYMTLASAILRVGGLSAAQMDEGMAQARERIYRALPIAGKQGGQADQTGAGQSPNQRAAKLDIQTVKRITADLKRHALTRRHMASAWAVFYITSAARIGWRPFEVQGTEISDNILRIKTAKIRNGQEIIRPFPLDQLPKNARMAAIVINNCLPAMCWLRFERWRNGMAEALAQSCDRLGIPRVSLYMFRHIAIQTWRATGISAADIAALAGHFNLRTASRHYSGRATAGWMEGFHLAEGQLLEEGRLSVRSEAKPEAPPAPVIDLDDFPVPAAPARPSGEGAANWRKYRDEKLIAPIAELPSVPGSTLPRPRGGPK